MQAEPADRQFSLTDLATLTGLSVRTVRYYLQIGLMDKPLGEKRGAYYLKRHLDQLLQVRRWVDAGMSLERIAELASGAPGDPPPRPSAAGSVEIWSRLLLADGVELHLSPDRAGLNAEQARELVQRITLAYRAIRADNESPS
jgi:DNA-binding transcriptional MerR regulator